MFCRILLCAMIIYDIARTNMDGYTPTQAFVVRLIAFAIDFGLLYGGGFFS